jgi:hypothetical protein
MKRNTTPALWSALAGVLVAGVAVAGVLQVNVSASKLQIKDNAAKPEKRQAQVQSKDVDISAASAGTPNADGASVHLYSATDDSCHLLPPGGEWKVTSKGFNYKGATSKNQLQIEDGKLKVKIKSGLTFSLADDAQQGTVNAVVQFGNAYSLCLRCDGNKKDDAKQFQGQDCVATACDSAPSVCNPFVTTTTSTTTTTTMAPGVVLQGVLPRSNGRFNYGLGIGVPGSDAACADEFPGTHTCQYSELQAAESAGDLDGITDTNGQTVTSFWVIDPSELDEDQCTVTVAWDYATAHTGQFALHVDLNNGAGTLGSVTNSFCGSSRSVGCCLD